MKKIYISLPISGREMDKVRIQAKSAKTELRDRGYSPVSPLDVCEDPEKPYSYYMGRDVEALLECDGIFMCDGWEKSKGCTAEFAIAKIYGLEII